MLLAKPVVVDAFAGRDVLRHEARVTFTDTLLVFDGHRITCRHECHRHPVIAVYLVQTNGFQTVGLFVTQMVGAFGVQRDTEPFASQRNSRIQIGAVDKINGDCCRITVNGHLADSDTVFDIFGCHAEILVVDGSHDVIALQV